MYETMTRDQLIVECNRLAKISALACETQAALSFPQLHLAMETIRRECREALRQTTVRISENDDHCEVFFPKRAAAIEVLTDHPMGFSYERKIYEFKKFHVTIRMAKRAPKKVLFAKLYAALAILEFPGFVEE